MAATSMYQHQTSFTTGSQSAPYTSNADLTSQTQTGGVGKSFTLDPSQVLSGTVPRLTTDNDADMRAGTDSPESDIVEVATKPDITIFCPVCDLFVDLRALNEHRTYHRALETLQYRNKSRPASVEALLKRRKAILRKLKKETSSEQPLDSCELQKLNDAFEFLKTDLEDTFEEYRQIRENISVEVQGVALSCSTGCAYSVGICSHANTRWKNHMEDTRVFQDCYGNDPNKCFYGIYDGHHGQFAAEVAAKELHRALLIEMEKFDPRTKCTCTYNMADNVDVSRIELHSRAATAATTQEEIHSESTSIIQHVIKSCEEKLAGFENDRGRKSVKSSARKSESKSQSKKKEKDPFASKMADAFKKAHRHTDILLSWGKDECSKVRWSGCSTLTCVIQSEHQGDGDSPSNSDHSNTIKGNEEVKRLGTIHLANAGTAKAVLVRGNRAYPLTRTHTPHNPREKARVLREGATINESEKDLRVNGVLAATRGLGNHGDPLLKRCILADPYTTSVAIDQYGQFIILASNGVWDVFSEQEAASLLMQILPANRVPAPSRISSTVQLLLEGPRSVTSSESQSEVATDYIAANRMANDKVFGGYYDSVDMTNHGILRPGTSQSHKSKTNVSILLHSETAEDKSYTAAERGEIQEEKSSMKNVSQDVKSSRTPRKAHRSKSGGNVVENLDLTTEIGSQYEVFSDNDSGNDGDVDTTFTEVLTLPSSRGSHRVQTREELQREYGKLLAERLIQAALLAGAKDNLTAMVILLPGSGL